MDDRWRGKRVVILGAARQGTALARYLALRGAEVVLNDRCSAEELEEVRATLTGYPIEWVLGGHPFSLLEGTNLLCLSGGIPLTLPLVQEAIAQGIALSNDSQIFLEEARCTVIGITGSAGKSTTTALVGQMIKAAQNSKDGFQPGQVWVGGNIGTPLLNFVDMMCPSDVAVLELSSFQLELMTISPHVAGVLNLTPNHLDRHVTMEAYTAAKARILAFQKQDDVAVLGRDDVGAWGLADHVQGRLLTFGRDEPSENLEGTFLREGWIRLRLGEKDQNVLPLEIIRLRGDHNLQNVLAACALSGAAGISPEAMAEGVRRFAGMPHRLEFVRSWKGADWYNDSIATAPERAMAAIRSFDEPLVLLAGGRDKNLPWNEFAELVRERVDHLILFGEAVGIIQAALSKTPYGQRPYSVSQCQTLEEALRVAVDVIEEGDVVLLAPGGTSFDAFRDFEERGEYFRKWVMEL
ncbi:MAG: UDP-N-acetylmuramoyl-L-alanine--D-glutamate ligase [Chloroflexota bacterium]